MLQKVNTVLLVAILGVLVFVALRPQPGRYHYARGIGYTMAVLDTATGELDFRSIEFLEYEDEIEEWRKGQKKAKAEAAKVKREIAHAFWLLKNCPDILAGKVQPRSTDTQARFDPSRDARWVKSDRQKCEEWQKDFPSVAK